ncbi:MAG: DUF4388 domain-containing protein, partial [Planctomycetota bacterium]|nr:DUF4388 domain-containing protein [Planctomycetota bacterium]
MGGSKAIMHDQGLDFLLRQTNTTGDGAEMVSKLQDKSENITIRGELNKISLTDIFQTLSMSKMEGILRVHRPLENRLVHFQESGVRLLMIDRDETRRIGHRLVQSGLISAADLRSALLEQQQSKMPLGEALVGSGKITEERLATTLQNQLEEDLYSLFTWDSGSFEFYKHVGEEDGFAQMIEGTPGFLIDGILLEVARRADEWREILRVIGSVHEVPYFVQDQEPTEMADDVRTLFTAVDEISTVQELADATMLGLFTCAKAVCSLIQQDILALSPATALVELARTAAHHGDHKRTLQLSQTAQSHQDEINFELSHSLAGILQTCREPKLGAQILMSCADSLSDPKSKLAIGKSAYELDRYSHEVLLFLRTQLELDDQHATPLFAEVTDQLCSTLADRGDYELALRFHADLEELHPHEASLLIRKARILQAADRTEDALSSLAEARTLIEPTGDKTRLIKLYEQILKLNPQAKDVKKALRELRNGKLRARQRQLGTILIGLAALGILWLGWSWYDHNRRFETAVTNFRDSLSKQDINGARQHLAAAQLELGEGNKWNMLRDELTATTARVDARRKSAEIKAVQQSLSQAGDLIQSGQVAEALTIYQGQLA